MKKLRWTEKEIQTLRDYCSEGISSLLEKLPRRNEQAIRTKCSILNLSVGDAYIVTEKVFMVV